MHQTSYDNDACTAYNFGPYLTSSCSVKHLLEMTIKIWPGQWRIEVDRERHHEAQKLNLSIEKSCASLGWKPLLSLEQTIEKTVSWYQNVLVHGQSAYELCVNDIVEYMNSVDN